ncbi:MAG: putative typeIV fimbrial fimT-related pilin [Gammaproteobacteria bacterium]|jgi:type IV fimbrial biogenesis protein FimT|nr:putative typeIV fimbrial fimT-related pilin [Gammaproteobacteria bacterium]MDB6107655.1 putative typeIV fimbrial fimT-related pilin [Gammaproteobacteria bacterium]
MATHTTYIASEFRNASGFTLVELATVMTIVAILMGIGVPSYRYVTTSNRMSAEVNGLLGDAQFARSEAIKEGQTVTVCTSTDGATCANSTAWNGGWIVFSDTGTVGTVDGNDAILRVQNPFSPPSASGGDSFQSSNNLAAVTFNREGFAQGLPNAGVILTLHDSTSNGGYTRCLSITLVGMMATQTHSTFPATCT